MQVKAICTQFKSRDYKGNVYTDVTFVDANPNPLERFVGEISLARPDVAALKEQGVKVGAECELKIQKLELVKNGNPVVHAVIAVTKPAK